jgi:hypothetical protein
MIESRPAGMGQVHGRELGLADGRRDSLRSAGLLGGLAVIVALRWAATVAGVADALLIGLGFGVALLALGTVENRPLS